MTDKERIEEWKYSRDASPLLRQLDEEYMIKCLALMGKATSCECQIELVKHLIEKADDTIRNTPWFAELDAVIYAAERELKAWDEKFSIPNDYSCESCGSTDGQWVYDKLGNGMAIICSCGNRTKIFRSWKEEVRSSTSKVKEDGRING